MQAAAAREQRTTYTRADFLRLHYQTDGEHVGRVIGQLKSSGELRRYFVAPADRAAEEIDRITDHAGYDYYITANAFTGRDRNYEQLFTLHNIVIDIDSHAGIRPELLEYKIEALLYFLRSDLQGVPQPNSVVKTGRGLQLWWACEPISGRNRGNLAKYEAVREELLDALEELLAGVPTLAGLEIDRGASKNAAGLYRLPGSYNTKAGRRGSFELWHVEPVDVLEQAAKLQKGQQAAEGLKPGGKIRTIPQGGAASYNMAKSREKALLSLLTLRESEGNAVGEGLRDQFLFCLCCAWEGVLPHEEILDKLDQMNQRFADPLPDREWRAYMRSCERKLYKISNKKIIERLEITEAEQQAIGLYPGGSGKNNRREQARQEAREKKAARDAQIAELYQVEGKTAREIADALGCSEQTVANVLQRAKIQTHEEELHARILRALEHMSPAEAADAVGVSLRTIYNHKRKEEAAQEAQEAAQSFPEEKPGKLSSTSQNAPERPAGRATEAPEQATGRKESRRAAAIAAAAGAGFFTPKNGREHRGGVRILPFPGLRGRAARLVKEIQKTPLYMRGISSPEHGPGESLEREGKEPRGPDG